MSRTIGALVGCRSLLIAGIVLWATCPPAAIWAEVTNPNGVAVIIGNKVYEHERVPEVSYAHRDAAAFRRYVTEVMGFDPINIIELYDASQADLESAFGNERSHEGELWAYLDPEGGSDVVVFYSGHGVPGLQDGRGYLLPSDANPDTADINGYPIDLLYESLGKLEEARSIAVYLDACFSGDSHDGMLVRSASPVYVRTELPAASAEKLTVLTAASGTELASWDEAAQHGLFTNHLLDALYGKSDADGDGQVTAAEVAAYLKRHMTRAARRLFRRHQNASLNGLPGVVLSSAVEGVFPARPVFSVDGTAVVEPQPVISADETTAEVGQVTIQRDIYLLGMTRAHEEREHDRVLEFVAKLTELGGELPAIAGYYQGLAYVRMRRHADAREALRSYLVRTGKEGEHYQVVIERLLELEDALAAEERVYQQARSTGTAAAYAEYLENFPHGGHAQEVLRLQAQARDDEAYERARRAATAASYAEYVKTHPHGRHVEEARRLQTVAATEDDEAFEEARTAGTAAAYGAYLSKYANGQHAAEARRLQAAARDDEAYAQARNTDTSAAYETYLRAHPNGRHAAQARRLQTAAKREEERLRPGSRFRDCDECPQMVVVPSGSFVMGSPASEERRLSNEGPQHRVTMREPFAVGVYEVTFAEWDVCVEDGGCRGYRFDDQGWGRGSRPVINVSWEDARAYVGWLSRKTGEEYRLLSEAEWEYAARAGTTTPFHHGPTISTSQANYHGDYTYGSGRKGQYRRKTVPVGSFAANEFGLHDVHGNVWEWTQDCWNDSYAGAPTDGRAWESDECGRRVLRGGSWINAPGFLRSAVRLRNVTGGRDYSYGFRVARTLTS